ncbi:replication initiator protein A [Deinococcus sp. Leaf326]|uniref:replication initiator protein A n=1 Tax=Deinococcus sp. Leaf326 TaxID=1736338 RepID=UPI000AEB5310|nr:replication initiator protein A [Deinococcus sp. Leaf326]
MKRLQTSNTLADERFIAQLGIISIQNRIDPSSPQNRRWISEFTVQDTLYHVEGFAADFGRPRGVDTDVQLAVETLFLLQGCQAHNTVTTSAYELLQMCQMTNKGTNYVRLRESLMRLWRVGFLVTRAHYVPGSPWATYLNETLGLFQRVRFWSQGRRDDSPDLSSLVADGKLLVQLSEPLADSIRAGYTQSLDRRLLSQIEQPAGRATYRILQAHRPAEGPLEVGLMDWGAACGVLTDQPDKIRRTLQAAHEELIDNAYLEDVVYVGRGTKQKLEYHFRVEGAPDPALVHLLTEQSIPRARAERLAAQHPAQIEAAVRYVQQRRQQGLVKSPGGLTTDILLHPEKYSLPAPSSPSQERRIPDLRKVEREVEQLQVQQQETLLALPAAEQWVSCLSTLKFLLARSLSLTEWELLEQKCRAGTINAAELTRELSATVQKAARRERVLSSLGPLS